MGYMSLNYENDKVKYSEKGYPYKPARKIVRKKLQGDRQTLKLQDGF